MDEFPLAYHITFTTHGSRLHGDERPTVDRQHNEFGARFVDADPTRWSRERDLLPVPSIRLTHPQRAFIEQACPTLCARGGWDYHIAAAAPDHVHVLLSARADGKTVRRILKRWLSQSLSESWPPPPTGWWTECGSVKWLWKEDYLMNAARYIERQSTTVLVTQRPGPLSASPRPTRPG